MFYFFQLNLVFARGESPMDRRQRQEVNGWQVNLHSQSPKTGHSVCFDINVLFILASDILKLKTYGSRYRSWIPKRSI